MNQTYLTRKQVAEIYPISANTLATLASQGRGPVFYKPTDKALYKPEDIEKWIEASPAPLDQQMTESASHTGRGRRPGSVLARAAPRVKDVVSPSTGRRLKSLTPSAGSWLRRSE